MATFKNPNSPRQPKAGVYGWFAQKNGLELPIYLGQAGERMCILPNGTLLRGVGELCRIPFTSNHATCSYSSLDTNFIVGTAILYFEQNGYTCEWRHIDDDPKKERTLIAQQTPILQNPKTAKIKEEFRVRKDQGYWKSRMTAAGINEATDEIFSALDRASNGQEFVCIQP